MAKTVLLFCSLLIAWHQITNTLSGKWKLTQYTDFRTGKIDSLPAKYDDQKHMVFNLSDNQKEGKLYGQTIRNEVYGNYTLLEKNKIEVSGFGGTKVGELNKFGDKFWDAMRKATTYKIDGTALIIYYDNDTKCMLFIKL